MPNLRYFVRLRKLQRQRARIRKRGTKLLKEAREQKKSRQELDPIIYDELEEVNFVEDEIYDLQTRHFLRQAERHFVDVPLREKEGAWEQSKITNRWRLTRHGLAGLRTAVRQENKERREQWQSWGLLLVGIFGTLTGAIGVLTVFFSN